MTGDMFIDDWYELTVAQGPRQMPLLKTVLFVVPELWRPPGAHLEATIW